MSTRCNVVVSIGRSKIFMYRHHDGYLAEAGADLALELKAVAGEPGARMSPGGMADSFVRALFAKRYEKASYEKEPRAIWELTNDLHGDIERCYWIEFGERGGVNGSMPEGFIVSYAARPKEYPELERWINEKKRGFASLGEFVAAVNGDREESNRRIRELNAEAGRPRFEEYGLIGMEVA